MSNHLTRANFGERVITALLAAAVLMATFATMSGRVRAADTGSAAVYICKPALSGETSNARMTATTDTSLSCRAVSAKLKMSNGSMRTIGQPSTDSINGPDLSKALSPDQINDAWVMWLDQMFNVNHTS